MRRTPPTSKAPAAGGCMLALGLIVGAAVGSMLNQATLGLMIGGAFGVGVAVLLFLIDRRG